MIDLPALDPDSAGEFMRAVGFHIDHMTATEVRGYVDAGAEHHTPWGIVHGGLYATVIESAASIGASIAALAEGQYAVGVSNQTDFLRPHTAGRLTVSASPIQQGRTLQLWLVELSNAAGKLVARGQVRLAQRPIPPE